MSGDEGRAVPRGRLARAGQFGRLAGGVAGGMLAEGARRLAAGERPSSRDLLLTPANLTRLADRLAHLRGAAMKLGQMISLDSGDFLPPELSDILARLRSNAFHMPPQQLSKVLEAEWGKDWRRRFKRFQAHPIAAASIGQVHRAETHDGRVLAIKVQYPGVAESIDADVDNVAALLRVSGLLPAELDIGPLLAEAKAQLAREADYVREGQQLRRYGRLLGDAPEFVVPTLDDTFTTPRVLAMSFVESRPIETLDDAPQDVRDLAMTRIVTLVLREVFDFGVMQTDPNYANYRLLDDGRIALLDFGAAQDVPPAIAQGYRTLLAAALAGDAPAVAHGAVAAGFIGQAVADRHAAALERMVAVVLAELDKPGLFDFGDRAFLGILREEGLAIAADKASWHLPPADLLFVQRKISGTALLGARFKARVDVRRLVAEALTPGTGAA
ncbi:putative unusual protein kinase regulating ubiquinone biosynthesis (AarF/ABC1/UbiB family) [Sphingomonas kaistensis]|uniref:Putative unusual protein kinase regulating ubiquinone biosynthesis (AarF/ABC1/UbiB family) n=1 Tax=Sphingomonas kaistensis TaxID=298708 RepID=A0A7X5Y5G4_9SPHN|nr:putative unusual protein kinase regulating ubiquinone biosynthesis (AarF/ABC1/UbiB family) [Sphingomonas kaistensis]